MTTMQQMWRQSDSKKRLVSIALIVATIICFFSTVSGSIIAKAASAEKKQPKILTDSFSASLYTPTRKRIHARSTSNTYGNSGYQYGNYYYNLSDVNSNCTWCAIRDLLNRRLVLDGANVKTDLISFKTVSAAIALKEENITFSREDSYVEFTSNNKTYIYIEGYDGDRAEALDTYYPYSYGGKSGNYKVSKMIFKYYSYENQSITQAEIDNRKNTLKTKLDEHPEGIFVYYCSPGGSKKHGFLLTGYYYENNSLKFYAHDTGGDTDTYGTRDNYKIREVHVGKDHESGNEENVIKYLTYCCYIEGSTSGNNNTPTPTANVTPAPTASATPTPAPSSPMNIQFKDFWLGDNEPTTKIIEGNKCNINGTLSGTGVSTIEVFVATLGNYTTPIYYTNGNKAFAKINTNSNSVNYSFKKSELDNAISFGKIAPGKYNLVIIPRDSAGNASGKPVSSIALEFEIVSIPRKKTENGITIDMTGFNTTLFYGNSYNIIGTITSPVTIRTVEAKVLDSAGKNLVQYRSGFWKTGAVTFTNYFPQVTQYTLKQSKVDNNISFGGLNRGNYILQIKVINNNSKSCTFQIPIQVK